MKKLVSLCIFSLFLLITTSLNAQVVISLLFGDKLNTPKIEFGMMGGLNRSFINDINSSEGKNNFNLGFYFHIQMKNSSYISTGVMVKSNVGATGMPTYSINNAGFDTLYKEGVLTKKISCFYVPILFHQRFNNRWYIEAGPQLGLIHKTSDHFKISSLGGDLTYTADVMNQYKRIDAGFLCGVGFKTTKDPKSMSIGVSYYYGFVNVSKVEDQTIKNSSLNFFVKIPIGLGKEPKKN